MKNFYRTYNVGDWVEIYLTNHKGERTKCQIIHKFNHQGLDLYIMEIPCPPVGEIYECRSGDMLAMRPSNDYNPIEQKQ